MYQQLSGDTFVPHTWAIRQAVFIKRSLLEEQMCQSNNKTASRLHSFDIVVYCTPVGSGVWFSQILSPPGTSLTRKSPDLIMTWQVMFTFEWPITSVFSSLWSASKTSYSFRGLPRYRAKMCVRPRKENKHPKGEQTVFFQLTVATAFAADWLSKPSHNWQCRTFDNWRLGISNNSTYQKFPQKLERVSVTRPFFPGVGRRGDSH